MLLLTRILILMFFLVPAFAYEMTPHPYQQGYTLVTCDDGQRIVLSGTFRLQYKALDKCGESQGQARSPSNADLGVNEALAFCWKGQASQWLCDGRIQRTSTGSPHLQVQLNAVGCDSPRKQSPLQGGTLFYCGYLLDNRVSKTKNTWNRDIRLWRDLD